MLSLLFPEIVEPLSYVLSRLVLPRLLFVFFFYQSSLPVFALNAFIKILVAICVRLLKSYGLTGTFHVSLTTLFIDTR